MAREKSYGEARVERVTWALLVLIFAVTQVVPINMLPNWFVPGAGALILLASGIYQYSRRWRVSPITWIGGVLMLLFALTNLYVMPTANFLGPSLLIVFGVIIFGVITGET